ncbi:hypothetical protein H5410_056129 [Solanum commersonii]|uniref:Uncharacterized protein n=1 Tax=Solanum commersonii TaxID=4109 RepID=A0A9J5WJF1_SOLCO|nr:hypothetical protein H5410_056129 [Solanum commersonii]
MEGKNKQQKNIVMIPSLHLVPTRGVNKALQTINKVDSTPVRNKQAVRAILQISNNWWKIQEENSEQQENTSWVIHATEIITTNAQVMEMKEWRTKYNNNATGDNTLAIVEIPLASEEALAWIAEEDNITDQHEEQIHRDADLSPRVIKNHKYERKGKKKEMERFLNLLDCNPREEKGLNQ